MLSYALTLNYFNYFTEIEDAFVRRRGKHLLLSPMDWALIESWKEMNVPLHVALRGIEKSFDSWESKPRKRSIKTLLYCQEEVEAQHAEWLETRVGEQQADEKAEAAHLPRTAVLEHLQRARLKLLALADERKQVAEDQLSEAFDRVASLLRDLEQEFTRSSSPDTQKLETSLTGLERVLTDAIRLAISSEELAIFEQEVKDQLQRFKSHMDKAVYAQTVENLVLKQVREHFAVPRLSLFYL